MNRRKQQQTAFVGAMCYALMAGAPALADDTEIFSGSTGSNTTPNVVFLVDTSVSMSNDLNGITRLQTVKNELKNLLNNTNDINLALMRFQSNANGGGYFLTDMQPIDDIRSSLVTPNTGIIDSLDANDNTPLSGSLYEIFRYLNGDSALNGNNPHASASGIFTGNSYKSPITSSCAQTHVVLLTDGSPYKDGDNTVKTNINSLRNNLATQTAYSAEIAAYFPNDCYHDDGSGPNDDAAHVVHTCLDDLAYVMHRTDFNGRSGDPAVKVHTVAFTTTGVTSTLLENTATYGGGTYKSAANAGELSTALTEILDSVGADARGSFVAPALGSDAFNRTTHRNALYFALFQNNGESIWDGNVKAYKLGGDPPHIVDLNGNDALTSDGEFVDNSRSLWSTAADGAQVVDGGANEHIPASASRHLFTKADNTAGALTPLSAAEPALFGISTGDTAADNSTRDEYVATALSSTIADPLHSQPVVVNYGGTEENPDITLFMGTNAGFLHAINAITGVERFAYAPKDLLETNIAKLGTSGSHLYGLDGTPVIWMDDTNGNGTVESGEHVYAYIGMRRGGSNYYALDVTNRDAPQLKWAIEGGSGNFTELGQTWSKPVLTRMRHNGTVTKVLIFAGGYDTNQDNYHPTTADGKGRAIYIVNALTGARLWWAGPSDSGADTEVDNFTHSIPSDVRVIDTDRDGYADRLYVGDTGGHVFRVDLPTSDTGPISGTVTTLASLGGNASNNSDNRRFFYAPDVVLAQQAPGSALYYAINIGSGYRAHPKDKGNASTTPPRVATNDRFYSIKDLHVNDSDFSDYTAVNEGDMLDVTGNDIGQGDADAQQAAVNALNSADNRGWYIRLETTGEKVLAGSLTINGTTYFTSYVPPSSGGSGCVPPIGNSRLYKVSLFNATPVVDNSGDGTMTATDRFITLDQGGIAPAPTLVFLPDPTPPCTGDCDPPPPPMPTRVVCAGLQCDTDSVPAKMYRSYWTQR